MITEDRGRAVTLSINDLEKPNIYIFVRKTFVLSVELKMLNRENEIMMNVKMMNNSTSRMKLGVVAD